MTWVYSLIVSYVVEHIYMFCNLCMCLLCLFVVYVYGLLLLYILCIFQHRMALTEFL